MQAFNDPTTPQYARTTGLLYLGIAVFGAFAIGYVPSQIITGDPATTLETIAAKRGLFNAGLGADALVMTFEILVTTMLFQMFRRVNETLALAMTLARFAMVTVMATQMLFQAGLAGMSAGDVPTDRPLAALLLQMHHAGIWVWQVFFTIHLVILGTLILRSAFAPRMLGLGLIVGGTGYFADSLYAFAFPEFTALGLLRIGLLTIVTLSEVGFALWLAIRAPRAAPPPAICAAA